MEDKNQTPGWNAWRIRQEIMRDVQLSSSSRESPTTLKIVLIAIENRAGDVCTASYVTLARYLNTSHKTVARAAKALAASGHIVEVGERNNVTHYRIGWDKLIELCSTELQESIAQNADPEAQKWLMINCRAWTVGLVSLDRGSRLEPHDENPSLDRGSSQPRPWVQSAWTVGPQAWTVGPVKNNEAQDKLNGRSHTSAPGRVIATQGDLLSDQDDGTPVAQAAPPAKTTTRPKRAPKPPQLPAAPPKPKAARNPSEWATSFDDFWSVYPANGANQFGARRAWFAVLKELGEEPCPIEEGWHRHLVAQATVYTASDRVRSGYIKSPTNWLKDRTFADDPSAWKSRGGQPSRPNWANDAGCGTLDL